MQTHAPNSPDGHPLNSTRGAPNSASPKSCPHNINLLFFLVPLAWSTVGLAVLSGNTRMSLQLVFSPHILHPHLSSRAAKSASPPALLPAAQAETHHFMPEFTPASPHNGSPFFLVLKSILCAVSGWSGENQTPPVSWPAAQDPSKSDLREALPSSATSQFTLQQHSNGWYYSPPPPTCHRPCSFYLVSFFLFLFLISSSF